MSLAENGVSGDRQRLCGVGTELASATGEITDDLVRLLMPAIPQLRADELLLGMLRSSIESNVATMFHMMVHGIGASQAEAPVAAVEYARRLAQRGVPGSVLVRAYRLCHERFTERCLAQLSLDFTDPAELAAATVQLTQFVFGYVDRVSEQVLAAHEFESERWLHNRAAQRVARVRALIDREAIDTASTEAILGYRLHQRHVGMVLWASAGGARGDELARLERVAGLIAEAHRGASSPLLVPYDESSAWVWLPTPDTEVLAADRVQAILMAHEPTARAALGEPLRGIDGFVRTHRQAVQAQTVALAADGHADRVTWFSDVGPLALMCSDLGALGAWVADTLGDLAVDDPALERLRETVLAFITTNGSHTATAARIDRHKNTVQYRIRKAEDILGRPLNEGRMELELALRACRELGGAVLRPRSE